MFHVLQAFYLKCGRGYRTNVPQENGIFLMNNTVMVITSQLTKLFGLGEEGTRDYLVGGARTIQ